MGNALRRNSFRKHQEKVGPEEVIEENLDRPVSLRPGSLAPPKEFPQNHKARGVNEGNSTLMWDYEKGNEPLTPKDEVCDARCEKSHKGRNCLVCRRSFGYHGGHDCLETSARGNFSLSHQNDCDTFCDGVHFGISCRVCGKIFEKHFEGHWCDEKISQFGNFGVNFTTIKRAIG